MDSIFKKVKENFDITIFVSIEVDFTSFEYHNSFYISFTVN